MKKAFLFTAVLLAALTFTSCKEKKACWEITLTEIRETGVMCDTIATTSYVFGTESEVDEAINSMKESAVVLPGTTVTMDVTKKKLNKEESDCVAPTTVI